MFSNIIYRYGRSLLFYYNILAVLWYGMSSTCEYARVRVRLELFARSQARLG